MNAASIWSDKIPIVGGTYLVQYTGDWFPEGDRNNIKHELVHSVHPEEGGPIRILCDGRFLEESEMKGWMFAKVREVSAEGSDVLQSAAARVVELYKAQYLTGRGDGGRVAHAMKQLGDAVAKGSS